MLGLIVVATLAAFVNSQRLKSKPLILDRVTVGWMPPELRAGFKGSREAFTPNGDCVRDRIVIQFRTTVTDDGRIEVVRPDGTVVRTLWEDRFLKRYRFHRVVWDGATDAGGVAPPGRYKLRVTLRGESRELVTPGTIRVHEAEPRPDGCHQGGSGGSEGPGGSEGARGGREAGA